jgi:iron uptake system EfeUOB component EfeO/EfeM
MTDRAQPPAPTGTRPGAERRAERIARSEADLAARVAARSAAKRGRGRFSGGPLGFGPRLAIGCAVVAAAAGAVGGYAAHRADPAGAGIAIALNEVSCGTGWNQPTAGPQTFDLENTADNGAEIFLINPTSNAVYAEIANLGPHTSRPVSATLGSGAYAFRCSFFDGTALTSRTYRVPGDTPGPRGMAPITDLDLQDPVGEYRSYVQQSLPGLLADSERLDADLDSGNLAQARADWLSAHLDYERLGAAYGTFGNYDDEINGRATGLPGGVADPGFTGFHRIEYGLWNGQSAAQLAPYGDGLVTDIKALINGFPLLETPATDLPLRTHEILENTLQFQLTGIADYGSGTMLATALANLQGTRAVLGPLIPLLQQVDPSALASIQSGLNTVQADLQAAQQPDGDWTSVGQLPAAARQQLDGDLGGLLEQLSVVPNVLEERNSA